MLDEDEPNLVEAGLEFVKGGDALMHINALIQQAGKLLNAYVANNDHLPKAKIVTTVTITQSWAAPKGKDDEGLYLVAVVAKNSVLPEPPIQCVMYESEDKQQRPVMKVRRDGPDNETAKLPFTETAKK